MFLKEKQYLVSYRWSNNFGEYTFSTDNKINFEVLKEIKKEILKWLEKDYGTDIDKEIIILNIVCLSDL